MSGISRRYRLALGVGVLALIVGLSTPALAQENIQGSAVTAVNPITLTAGSTVTLCFTVNFISPDFEYMDHFDVDLPDGWTVGTVAANSVPAANGCVDALPPVVGNGAGNVVFWQSTGYPPTTGCGAWVGGSAGANFDFCVDVTVPSCTGAPWSLPWNIIGDGYGGVPHTVAGTFASVECTGGGGPAVTLAKSVGTVPGVCAATNAVTVSSGTDVYYCFQATNTGTVTFELHDLVDDHLGTILNNFPYTLAPGASSPEVIVPDTATATVTNTATWTAADLPAGYVIDDTITYNFEDIAATGTAVALTDDSTATFPIGFGFDFYGTVYTDFWASSNGFLATTGTSNGCCSGQNLPNASAPNGVIAGWWEDMNPSGGGTHHYQVLGSAPNRRLIFQVTNVPHYSTGNLVTLQYKLFEGTNVIEVHYQAAPSDGGSHTAGIENQDGTVAALYYYGTAALTTPLAIRYTPTVPQEASAVATATVTISDPDITVDPGSLASVQAANQVVNLPLTLGNVGTAVLNWTLDEEPVEAIVFPPIGEPAGPSDPAVAVERVGDGPPEKAPDWYPETVEWVGPELVLYDNGPLVTHPGQGGGGADASALQTALGMSTYGTSCSLSTGYRVADDFTVTDPAGWDIDTITVFPYQTGSTTTSTITSLNLRIWNGAPNDPASVVVWGDTTTNILTSTTWTNIYRVTDTTLTTTNRPIMTAVGTVNTVLPAGTYWLDWQVGGSLASGPWAPAITILGQTTTGNAMQQTVSTGTWAAFVDVGPQGLPFIIEGMPAICGALADVPWLSASPTSGSIAPAGTDPVTVSLDSTGLAVGLYEATLCVFSDDPDEGVVPVPVSLEVTAGQGAAIELNKTVGVVPGVCAATDSITVSTGTPVYYCFVAENTGDVTFNYHNLVDDHLGVILNNFAYTLAPGAFSPEVIVPSVASGAVVNTGTWEAADVVGGYAVDDTIAYNFEDISGTGTAIPLTDDSVASFPIGFTFDYYGGAYTNFYVSSNGFLSDVDWGSGCCTGMPLPDTGTPNGVIAGWWEDLNPSSGGTIQYQTLGSAPNRRVIVQFTNVPHYSTGNNVTMQYKLYETTGVIEVHYQAAPSDGGTHSAGIENQDGTVGLQYYLGTAALTTPEAVRYTPAPAEEATDTDTASVQISDPDITVNPSSLASSQMTNTVVTLPLTIGNVGVADLVWDIEEAAPIEIPASNGDFPRGKAAPSFGPAPEESMATVAAGEPNLAVRLPGTFAFSTDAAVSTHVYFDSDTPGTLNTIGPATGYFWAGDFVGGDLTKTYVIRDDNTLMTVNAATGAETSIGTLAAPPGGETYTGVTFDPATGNVYATSCNITTSSLFTIDVLTATSTRIGAITNSPCSIGIGADDSGNLYTYDLVNDSFLSVNKTTGAGTIIGSLGFDANYGQGMDFDSVTGTMYLAAFNNATFQAEFRAVDLATGNTTFLGALGTPGVTQLGYVSFQSGGPCSSPSDLPWLNVNPTAGTTASGGTSPVDVTFDSTGIAVGTYDGVLCVNSNDPDEPIVEVPVQMDVVIPVELMGISIE